MYRCGGGGVKNNNKREESVAGGQWAVILIFCTDFEESLETKRSLLYHVSLENYLIQIQV